MRKRMSFPLPVLVFGCESVRTQPADETDHEGAFAANTQLPQPDWSRITSGPYVQSLPKIDGDLIVWEDDRSGNVDIWMHDLSTGQETPVETDGAEQREPDVSGSRIVWQDMRSGNWDVWMYNAVTGTRQQLRSDPGNEVRPRVSGDRIVWEGDVVGGMPGEFGVFMHDLSTGTTRLLQASHAGAPEIDGERIVSWWHCPFHPFRGICLYDLTTDQTTSISPPQAEDDRAPVISGDLVAWERYPAPGYPFTPRDIFAYDLGSSTEIRITDDTRSHHWPRVSGSRIAWAVGSEVCGGADLWVHDVATGQSTWLACGTGFRPDISGYRVVIDVGRDIYMIEIATPVEIDIKPGSDHNCVREDSKGRIAVAILASAGLDPADVDPANVLLEGVAPLRWSADKDVSGDGLPDYVFHFPTADLAAAGLLLDGTVLTLTGTLLDGTPIEGSDVIHLAGGPNCS